MIKYIKLANGQRVTVDAADFSWLNQWKWHLAGGQYAARHTSYIDPAGKKKRYYLYMHRQIASAPEGMDTDHINGNGLDNRRINLRVCSTVQNLANRGVLSTNTSGFKGVSLQKGRWIAQIGRQRNGVRDNTVIGRFETREEAARAYDKVARERYGEFAKLNFSMGG